MTTPNYNQQTMRQLAQSRPSGTGAVTLLSPIDKNKYIVYSVLVANTTGGAVNVSLFHDNDGTTYDQTTALLYGKSIAANDYLFLEFREGLPLESAAALGCQTSSASALNFTVYGTFMSHSGTSF